MRLLCFLLLFASTGMAQTSGTLYFRGNHYPCTEEDAESKEEILDQGEGFFEQHYYTKYSGGGWMKNSRYNLYDFSRQDTAFKKSFESGEFYSETIIVYTRVNDSTFTFTEKNLKDASLVTGTTSSILPLCLKGEWTWYNSSGEKNCSYTYENNKVVAIDGKSGPSFVFEYYIVPIRPVFPGGEEGLNKFFASNLKYPKKANRKKIEGRVWVEFIVNEDGSVSDIRLISGPHKLLNKEVIRVIGLLPAWKPGEMNGQAVKVKLRYPVLFLQ